MDRWIVDQDKVEGEEEGRKREEGNVIALGS